MITRRSVLMVFASAVFSGSLYAQDQVADGRPPVSLPFKITPLPVKSNADDLALMASYGQGDDETKFVIELHSESHGTFRHVTGGPRPTRFLSALGKALEASDLRFSDVKQDTLEFDIAFLGPATVRSSGGGFGGGPGDWYTTKIFLGQDQAEVYFNFNLVSGEAEFSIKDESYGDDVVSELSKVIW
ncbi:hypothetical protein ATY76_13830 [Rhizobium sp. R339]|uniref:hypothetical protein n=1 Tax=Rhizobium sp. R339 TaxID=1764273 RepID=UPI000B52C80A|nr:hypothetical protein [Rhizobium sp. R339]OWV67994.1 hypothetical protein ATY76_13830 [Rhizobium sp. R339]